jgi:Ni/Fe-hydrogenase 1 B-type cytochrome subunit
MASPNTGNPTSFDPTGVSTRKVDRKLGKVYVWQLPVRVFHWINVLCIILLMITGIYIGNPFVGSSVPEEAYYSNVMGWVRYIHFFAAFLFTANLIVRVYWFFAGNKYAKSNPLKKKFWTQVWETIKFYLFMKNKKEHTPGHNTLAQLSYWIFIGLGSVLMILTGFFLFFEPQLESVAVGKLAFLLGGDSFTIRSLHHIVAWGFMLFMVIHVYMAIRDDWLSRNGTLSSIFTGYKTEEEHDNNEK